MKAIFRFIFAPYNLILDIFTLKLIREAFYDPIRGTPVYLFEDRHGVRWMKNSKYDLFRVKSSNQRKEETPEKILGSELSEMYSKVIQKEEELVQEEAKEDDIQLSLF